MWSAVLTRLEVVLAGVAVLAAAKSAYNGTVRGLVDNIKEIPTISDRVDDIGDKQERMVDGMIALSVAESKDGASVDTDRLANDLRNGNSYRVYLSRGEPHKSPYADVEDEEGAIDPEIPEEELRWRQQRPDD